jgi:hypothetical protein
VPIYREPPRYDECIEALEVMIEAYGYHKVKEMLEVALAALKAEGA